MRTEDRGMSAEGCWRPKGDKGRGHTPASGLILAHTHSSRGSDGIEREGQTVVNGTVVLPRFDHDSTWFRRKSISVSRSL